MCRRGADPDDRDADWGIETARAAVREARERIATLSVEDGTYTVACKDAGVSPEPVAAATFQRYADAERARDAARRYRAAMRRLDPALAEYDLVVSGREGASVAVATARERTGERRENGLPRTSPHVTVTGDRTAEWFRIENGAVVHLRGRDAPLDDEFVGRQLRSKL